MPTPIRRAALALWRSGWEGGTTPTGKGRGEGKGGAGFSSASCMRGLAVLLLAFALWAIEAGQSLAADAPPAAGPPMTILGNDSWLRSFLAFKTPLVITKEGEIKPALEPMGKEPKPLPDFQSPLPPPGWVKTDFDDSPWDRTRAPVEMSPGGATGRSQAARHTATANSLICLRGKFIVADPAQAEGMKLSLEYVGGVVVYVNGIEIARASLPAGEVKPDTLADK
jgi:hypothetical protein